MVKFILNMRDRLKRTAGKDKKSDTDLVKPDTKASAEPSVPTLQSFSPSQETQGAQTISSVTDKKEEQDLPDSHPNSDQPKPPPRSRRRRSRRRGKPKTSNTEHAESEEIISDPQSAEPWDPASFHQKPVQGKTRFQDLPIPDQIMHGIADLGFHYCTPIQAEILPDALQGTDAMGRAQTGTGKSAAFLISIFNHLLAKPVDKNRRKGTPRALIIAPTRELVLQIESDARNIGKYTGQTIVAVFGGMDYAKQQRMLTEQQVDIIIATPGRLLDFKRRQDLHLSKVEILVIDEADRMLDMGFIPDVRNIIHSTPPKSRRQTMLFSATLTEDVIRLASQWTRNPVKIEIEPEQVAVDTVEQIVYLVTTEEKFALLMNIVTRDNANRVIVFANRRDQTRKLTELLERYRINTAMLSGEVAQNKRIRTLEQFREGKIRVLVATDVAGRGIHVDGVSHVINFTLPQDPEDYVHRIGRTGRAGANGISISFACESDSFQIPAIEEYIGHELKCAHPEDDLLKALPKPSGPSRPRWKKQENTDGSSQNRHRGGRSGRRNSGRAPQRHSPDPKPTGSPSSGDRGA